MDTIFYAKQDGYYVLKFVDDIRYALSYALQAFLDQLFRQKDFDDILVDLTETTSIDSTSLGLLAKIANFMREYTGRRATMISTNPDVNLLLSNVGFDQIFTISNPRS